MFRLPDSWVWDFWLADDGAKYHLFFAVSSATPGHPTYAAGNCENRSAHPARASPNSKSPRSNSSMAGPP